MSVEIVTRDDGRHYVIVGNPDAGYDVHRVDAQPVITFDRKYEARRAILDGQLDGIYDRHPQIDWTDPDTGQHHFEARP